MQSYDTSSQEKYLGSVTALQHDAFRRGKGRNGLGKSAGQIYNLLQSESFTVDELVTRTGRDKRTVKSNLAKWQSEANQSRQPQGHV